jgi:hypothetical protein
VSGDGGRPRPLDAFETVWQTALLSVRRGFRGGRFAAAAALVLFPLLLSIPVSLRASPRGQEELFYGVLGFYHFGLAVPAVALAFATAFPWPECDEGSLTWWFTAPVRRSAIHLGRFAAAAVVGWTLLPLSVVALVLPLGAGEAARLGSVAASAVGATFLVYPAYVGIFWLVSTLSRRGLALGVVFIVAENTLSFFQGNVAKLTLIHWVRSMVHPAIPSASRGGRADALLHDVVPNSVPACVAVFVGVALASLVLSLLLVERIEYRGKVSQAN